MNALNVALLLLAGVTLVAPLADRLGVPSPVALTVYGILLALLPGVPNLLVPPELVLPLILPPLLYGASQRSSTHEFTANWRALLSLAVVLILITTVAVAVVTRWVDSSVPLAAAVALGAIVSPPDPIAATSLAGRLNLPRRLVTVLEGEGLLNDALALVVYTVAVAAATTGHLSLTDSARILVLSVVVGPVVGLAIGWLGREVVDRANDPRAEVALSLLLPYGAYLSMEALGGSGVLAVVVAGLFGGQHGTGAFSSNGFLAGTAVWAVSDWVVTGLTFGLVGFELTTVLADPDLPTSGTSVAVAVCIAVVVTRALYVLPLSTLAGRRMRSEGIDDAGGWRESVVAAWAGMRGVVTLASALALPEDFPGRPVVLLAAIAVVLVTLLGQGLTLPLVVRALGVRSEVDETEELARLRRKVARAALSRLDELQTAGEVSEEASSYLREAYERMVPHRSTATRSSRRKRMDEERAAAAQLREVERGMVQGLRSDGEVTAGAANLVLADIESRELRDMRRTEEAPPVTS